MSDKVRELAKELQADGVKRGKFYKGYTVYEPVYNKPIKIGLPYVIFEKAGEVRLSTPEESFDYLDFSVKQYRRIIRGKKCHV